MRGFILPGDAYDRIAKLHELVAMVGPGEGRVYREDVRASAASRRHTAVPHDSAERAVAILERLAPEADA